MRTIGVAALMIAVTRLTLAAPDEAQLLEQSRAVDPYVAANQLGAMRSVPGLAGLIEQRDRKRLDAYVQGFQTTVPHSPQDDLTAPLGPELEALIVRHIDDPDLSSPLAALLLAGGYHNRTTFAELARRIAAPALPDADRGALIRLIVRTDLPVEAPLLELLRGPLVEGKLRGGACDLARFLARRRYQPALDYLAHALSTSDPALGACFSEALTGAGTAEALEAVMVYLTTSPGMQDLALRRTAISGFLSALRQRPPDAPLDLARIKAVLNIPQDDTYAFAYVGLAEYRHDLAAVPDLIAYLSRTGAGAQLHYGAVRALLAMDDPEAWRRARTELDRLHAAGAIDAWQYGGGTSQLDAALADPEGFIAKRRRPGMDPRDRALAEARRPLDARAKPLSELREGDAERFVVEQDAYLHDLEDLATRYPDAPDVAKLRQTIGLEYLVLGDVHRFHRHDAQRAVVCYERAERWLDPQSGPRATFARAETYALELDDRAAAVAQYRHLLGDERGLVAGPRREARPWERWLKYEIRDLQTGRRFAGRVGREDLVAGALGPIAVALTPSDVVQVLIRRIRAEVVAGNLDTAVALLRGLPPSHLVFLHTIGMLSLLPPAVVVSHLERHDPTRYWSAVVLASAVAEAERRHAGLWDERDPSLFLPCRSVEGEPRAPLEEAAAAFAARGGIRFDVGVFVEPDHTRQYFTDGLIGGDRRRALAACSSGGRHLLGPS